MAGPGSGEITDEEIERRMKYHPPTPERKHAHEVVRDSLESTMHVIRDMTPPSREQSVAFTKLEEAMFWANAAIARNADQ